MSTSNPVTSGEPQISASNSFVPARPLLKSRLLTPSVSVMNCDCSEQQAQRIECDSCNPLSCACEEGDSEICFFCEKEFLIYIQSDNDCISVISEENCSSISSRAGANSCIQSPQQHDHLSQAFGNTVSIANGGNNDTVGVQTADDPGEGPSDWRWPQDCDLNPILVESFDDADGFNEAISQIPTEIPQVKSILYLSTLGF